MEGMISAPLNVDPSIVALVYGPCEGVSTPKPAVTAQFTLDRVASRDKDAASIDSGNQRRLVRTGAYLVIHDATSCYADPDCFARGGCAKSPERAALDKANAFLDEGHVQAARDTVEYYLHQYPDSAPLLRMRVVVLLREQQLDQAALAMQQVPAGRSIVPEILRHRDRVVREGAAKLISDRSGRKRFPRTRPRFG